MVTLAILFCGLFVAGSDQPLYNDATQVVMMRKGTRTVLAMQNAYQGPPEAFAMVVPVPAVLHEGDVKTLPKEVFAHVEQLGAPRLVEYWEQDPCAPPPAHDYDFTGRTVVGKTESVAVEARFAVGEYQVVILSAKDSTALDAWLRGNKYNIPANAEPLLRPYVEAGSKFFVAKVDPQKVQMQDGRAVLSPLRFHYDADELSLPVRLGMANSPGKQDLIVNILAPGRYRVANYPNVTIPTNYDVADSVKDHFGPFYAALFDATLAKNPGAVVTEYAWQAASCDPCPGPVLDGSELATLGADVLGDDAHDFVLTRLHARYGPELARDLVFEQAKPITGGREQTDLDHGARASDVNTFQARYAIRHRWDGPIRCEHPHRGVWGGNPAPTPALDLAHAPRGSFDLAAAAPDLGPGVRVVTSSTVAGTAAPAQRRSGCGCQSSDPAGLGALVGLALVRPRRRRGRLMKA